MEDRFVFFFYLPDNTIAGRSLNRPAIRLGQTVQACPTGHRLIDQVLVALLDIGSFHDTHLVQNIMDVRRGVVHQPLSLTFVNDLGLGLWVR